MKKYITLFLIAVIFISGYLSIEKGEARLEDAIDIDSKYSFRVMHIENLGNDNIVYSFTEDDYIHISLIRKTLRGYKSVYSGIAGDVTRSLEVNGLIMIRFPGLDNSNDVRFVGLLSANETNNVKLIDLSKNNEVDIEVIESDGMKFWYAKTDIANRERITVRFTQVVNGIEEIRDLELFVFN